MKKSRTCGFVRAVAGVAVFLSIVVPASAVTYEVGTGKKYASISAVPLDKLAAGDVVRIYYRAEPYKEKFVIAALGTAEAPITIRGVPGPKGELPVIEGNNATTSRNLVYWGEERGVIKIGGATRPNFTRAPEYIVIENLDIKSARQPYTFTSCSGKNMSYVVHAGAIMLESGKHITIRNCNLRDSSIGILTSDAGAEDVTVEGCYIYDNGVVGSISQHGVYSSVNGITYQYNRLGALRDGCLGNALKDRSAGTTVRFNWVEGGNRQLDLVDSQDLRYGDDARYDDSYVYGNILIDHGLGNGQVVHFGGDTKKTSAYRKGTLYFYNNTVICLGADKTALIKLSTDAQKCDCRNNIYYTQGAGSLLSILANKGSITLNNNWIKAGWVYSHSNAKAKVTKGAGNTGGTSPQFVDFGGQDYRLVQSSPCIDAGAPVEGLTSYYIKHRKSGQRIVSGKVDIGAFEYGSGSK